MEATRSRDSSLQLFLDPLWSREDFTRETNPSTWKSKKSSRAASEPTDLSFMYKGNKILFEEAEVEIDQLLRKRRKSFPHSSGPSNIVDPITVDSESPVDSLGDTYYDLEGGADNEAPNSDDDEYEEPDFADGDLDEVARVINVVDYEYVPDLSSLSYIPTSQPELDGVIYVNSPPPSEIDNSPSARPGSPRELACKHQATSLNVDLLTKAIKEFRHEGKIILPRPQMRCYRFNHLENGGRVPRIFLTTPL